MGIWYVDKDAAGGDGTSWAKAWRRFADIAAKPGDTVYVSGGAGSKTYAELLSLSGLTGVPDAPITIDVGANSPSPAGHDGTVVLDGGGVRDNCILATSGTQYCRVNGRDREGNYRLRVQNVKPGLSTSRVIRCYNSTALDLDGIEIVHDSAWGVVFDNLHNSRVRGCRVHDSGQAVGYQGNGVYLQNGAGNTVENNTVIESNPIALPNYEDPLQIYGETDVTVRGNVLKWTAGAGNAYCGTLMVDICRGVSMFYNNLVVGCDSHPTEIWQHEAVEVAGRLYILNNTIVTQHPTAGKGLHVNNAGNQSGIAAFANNIEISPRGLLRVIELPGLETSKSDYNCLYTGGPYVVQLPGGLRKTWAQWQGMGFDVHGVSADPLLDADYRPKPGSPCIGAGADLSAYFSTDADGNPRPSGKPWTIGAYEYRAVAPPADPLAELAERVEALCAEVEMLKVGQAGLQAFADRVKAALAE